MKTATQNTEVSPSIQLRKVVFGGSPIQVLKLVDQLGMRLLGVTRGSLTAGVLLGSVILFSSPVASATPIIRVMPLGDSLTDSYVVPGGYRAPLYQLVTNAGYNLGFVGTLTDNGVASLPDPDHEGWGGYLIDQIASGFPGWVELVNDPDVIRLLIGTNDYGQNYNTPHQTFIHRKSSGCAGGPPKFDSSRSGGGGIGGWNPAVVSDVCKSCIDAVGTAPWGINRQLLLKRRRW